jgi:UDP-3-O-[3-hydroxymyristoyl] glucosamine N-acyltransferase
MPRTPRPIPLAELAAFLGTEIEGEASVEISGFASLGQASPEDLVFVRDAGHQPALAGSRARCVLTLPGVNAAGHSVLRSGQPGHDFSRLIAEFAPRYRPAAGIDPGAFVHSTAAVDPSASVEAGARVGPGCRVGANTVIASGAILVAYVEVGRDGWIHSGAILREDTRVGDRVVLQPGVVLGGDGFGYVPDAKGRPVAMAQRGCVVIEDDVEIGANTTVDRATLDETRIRRGAKIDNQVQIAHNCDIGEEALIVAQTGLSGGTVVGRRAILMAGVGTTGHLTIGEGAFIGARSGLHHDVAKGARMFGAPAVEERGWHRTTAALRRLPELLKRVRRLEHAASGDDGTATDGPPGSGKSASAPDE